MGGGRKKFTPKGVDDPEGGDGGKRDDGKNLIETWVNQKQLLGNASYVWHRNDLLALETSETEYLLGKVINLEDSFSWIIYYYFTFKQANHVLI